MADLSHVEDALVSVVAGAFYPDGTENPSTIGAGVRVYPGWPVSAALDADLAAGLVNVSVFPLRNERRTTRYPRTWGELSRDAKTVLMSVSGNRVTFSGSISTPQHLALLVNGKSYACGVQNTDTLNTLALGFANRIAPDLPGASSSGPVLTIPGAYSIIPRTGVEGTLARMLRQQEKQFQITVWAPTPDLRKLAWRALDPVIAALDFLSYGDGTAGRIVYVGSVEIDETQRANVYRRDEIYAVEFPTIETTDGHEITVIEKNITGAVVPEWDAPHQANN